ncbi:cytochrome P450 [Mycobacterium sp. MYCO198283]|uniref:cytochrome P450 n=1 Tax=Mycobacterium sp. MYCO198283 TaxID=2883505 RepID=UPI001E457ED7|nr:cytochrome P450 [Mycobacterium sp. MYCO198283]MCG5434327.1 cytochrome P450 [Mycobacterium sp. MYCO198283]
MAEVSALPLPPRNPLPFRERLRAVRSFHTGMDVLRDAGGPVTRFSIGPRWSTPPVVLVTSPRGIRDVLSIKDGAVDKTSPVFNELRNILGDNLANLPHEPWKQRKRTLQPVFTAQRVQEFGGHMAEAATAVCDNWSDGAVVDLDAEVRALTLRALALSVLGIDLQGRAEDVEEPLRVALRYAMNRALRPVRAPRWLPTPARRRARAAGARLRGLGADILRACRSDPAIEAPLVRALLAARDPDTGRGLTDGEICDELIIFLFAGHETTATTITYALWQLGRHPEHQRRVAAEVAAFPEGPLPPNSVARLPFTVQVVREALRLCPPAPTGTRLACRDIAVAGYRVPAGTMLVVGRMAVQRDPSLWDNAQVFDPDRFSPEKHRARDRWQYIPFGGGPRSCIGDHFAMLMATLAVATLVRGAEIHSLEDDFPVSLHFSMIAGAPIRAVVRKYEELS